MRIPTMVKTSSLVGFFSFLGGEDEGVGLSGNSESAFLPAGMAPVGGALRGSQVLLDLVGFLAVAAGSLALAFAARTGPL